MDLSNINWLAVIVAALSVFVVGGIWYSPLLFGNAWMKENGLTVDDVKKGNAAKIYGWTFILSLISAANLAFFMTSCSSCSEQAFDFVQGAIVGFLTGIWVFAGVAIVALFEQKLARHILINGSFMLVAFTLMGAILGVWR